MPNIMLKKSSISAISRQIERMQSETEDAEKKIRSALNGLDFEVASKQNIRNCLNNLITSANRQGNLSGQYKSAFLNVTNSVTESDSKYGNRSQSIFDKIKTFVDDTTKKFKDLFMRNRLAKIGAVTGLFIISPITVITVADIKLLEKIASIVKGWKQTPGEAIPITPPGILEKDTSEANENNSNNEDGTDSEPPIPLNGYDAYRNKVDELNSKNIESLPQIYNSSGTGLCTTVASNVLLNRRLAYDGKNEEFTLQNMFDSMGCTNVRGPYTGKKPAQYSYDGGTANWGSTKFTNSNGSSYQMHQERVEVSDYKSYLASKLEEHPEGVIVYSHGHAIVVTDYVKDADGNISLYAMDGVNERYNYSEKGRIPIESTWQFKSNNGIGNSFNIGYLG